MDKTQLTTTLNYANIGEPISHELGAKMVKDFQDAYPDFPSKCYNIGRNIIEQILSQPGCVGLRFYNAIDETGKKTLVYVGVDKNGNAILEYSAVDETGKLERVEALIGDRGTQGGGGIGGLSWI